MGEIIFHDFGGKLIFTVLAVKPEFTFLMEKIIIAVFWLENLFFCGFGEKTLIYVFNEKNMFSFWPKNMFLQFCLEKINFPENLS